MFSYAHWPSPPSLNRFSLGQLASCNYLLCLRCHRNLTTTPETSRRQGRGGSWSNMVTATAFCRPARSVWRALPRSLFTSCSSPRTRDLDGLAKAVTGIYFTTSKPAQKTCRKPQQHANRLYSTSRTDPVPSKDWSTTSWLDKDAATKAPSTNAQLTKQGMFLTTRLCNTYTYSGTRTITLS